MYLRPSEIRFSQDSIGSTFGRSTSHPYRPIGDTLDDILFGYINVHSIPNISVCKKNGLWFTADNRRLWVFQEAEKRGKCSDIFVRETFYIDYAKMTTINEGKSIYVRGNPGGYLWRKMPVINREPLKAPEVSPCLHEESFTKASTLKLQEKVTDLDSTRILTTKQTIVSKVTLTKLFQDRHSLACYEQDVSDDEEEFVNNQSQQSDDATGLPSEDSNMRVHVSGLNDNCDKISNETTSSQEETEDEKNIDDFREVEIGISGNLPNIANLNSHLEVSVHRESPVIEGNIDEESGRQLKTRRNLKKILIFCFVIVLLVLVVGLSLSLSLS